MGVSLPPPPELINVGRHFFNHDYKWGMKDFAGWAQYAIKASRITPDEKNNIKQYLTNALLSEDNAFISRLWHAMHTCVYIVTPDMGGERLFLSTIRDLL